MYGRRSRERHHDRGTDRYPRDTLLSGSITGHQREGAKPKAEANREDLTDGLIWKLAPPANGMSITWDSEVKGFGVRLTAAGARAFGLTKMERFYTQ